jgi:putative redox protein
MSDHRSAPAPASVGTAPAVAPVHRPSHIRATWEGEHLFDTGKANGPTARFDGSGQTAQTPPDALLSALASCSGVDVVDYLAKRRTPVTTLAIDVQGDRRELHPRRFEKIRLRFEIGGANIDRAHAERAVQLAFERYCSVSASLAPDIEISAVVVLNGEEGASLPVV